MNQCVPSWDFDENPTFPPRLPSNSSSLAPDIVPMLDYEVAELTWKNGQLAMQSLGVKPFAGGTLESIVNQATTNPSTKPAVETGYELVPWLDTRGSTPGIGTCLMGCSTRVGSCSVAPTLEDIRDLRGARLPHEWSSRVEQSACGSDSRQVTDLGTCEREFGAAGFASTSLESPGNTSSGKECNKTVDDHDSACHSRNQRERGEEEEKKKGTGKSSVVNKRSRSASIHNQSERKRRDKINQRMKTLQMLVPNSSKTDKASMLDEVIEYLKQLQGQVHMMSRMNMSTMMLPLALQQQLQLSMMAPMGMGMGMGMNMGMGMGVMDMSQIGRPSIAGMPPHVLLPNPFMPATSWDIPADRLATPASSIPDPFSTAFLACQSQPMTMDAYSRMATLYQQFQAPSGPPSKDKVK